MNARALLLLVLASGLGACSTPQPVVDTIEVTTTQTSDLKTALGRSAASTNAMLAEHAEHLDWMRKVNQESARWTERRLAPFHAARDKAAIDLYDRARTRTAGSFSDASHERPAALTVDVSKLDEAVTSIETLRTPSDPMTRLELLFAYLGSVNTEMQKLQKEAEDKAKKAEK